MQCVARKPNLASGRLVLPRNALTCMDRSLSARGKGRVGDMGPFLSPTLRVTGEPRFRYTRLHRPKGRRSHNFPGDRIDREAVWSHHQKRPALRYRYPLVKEEEGCLWTVDGNNPRPPETSPMMDTLTNSNTWIHSGVQIGYRVLLPARVDNCLHSFHRAHFISL